MVDSVQQDQKLSDADEGKAIELADDGLPARAEAHSAQNVCYPTATVKNTISPHAVQADTSLRMQVTLESSFQQSLGDIEGTPTSHLVSENDETSRHDDQRSLTEPQECNETLDKEQGFQIDHQKNCDGKSIIGLLQQEVVENSIQSESTVSCESKELEQHSGDDNQEHGGNEKNHRQIEVNKMKACDVTSASDYFQEEVVDKDFASEKVLSSEIRQQEHSLEYPVEGDTFIVAEPAEDKVAVQQSHNEPLTWDSTLTVEGVDKMVENLRNSKLEAEDPLSVTDIVEEQKNALNQGGDAEAALHSDASPKLVTEYSVNHKLKDSDGKKVHTQVPDVTHETITASTVVACESLQGEQSSVLCKASVSFRLLEENLIPPDQTKETIPGDLESETDDDGFDSQREEDNNDEYEDEDDEDDETEESNSSSEVYLNDEQVQELVNDLLKTESEAADAQEVLEEESLLRVREEVRMELAESLGEAELDAAVEEEMKTYIEQWEESLEELQEQSSLLQEKLEDAGVSLPDLFKWIEKQALEGCSTEAWKRRTHWAGLDATVEVEAVLKHAEEDLKVRRPTRSQRGKLVNEGASGFLERKLAAEGGDDAAVGTSKHESRDDGGWSKVEDLLDTEECPEPGKLMGTKRWAAVYLASTPEQAAQLGLALPGIDTVEEIGDVESEKRSLFKAALKNECERGLTERQKTSIKKVREEDDVKKGRRIQNRPRKRLSRSQVRKSMQVVIKKSPPGLIDNEGLIRSKEEMECSGGKSVMSSEKLARPSSVRRMSGSSGRMRNKWSSGEGAEIIELLSDDEGAPSVAEIGTDKPSVSAAEHHLQVGKDLVHEDSLHLKQKEASCINVHVIKIEVLREGETARGDVKTEMVPEADLRSQNVQQSSPKKKRVSEDRPHCCDSIQESSALPELTEQIKRAHVQSPSDVNEEQRLKRLRVPVRDNTGSFLEDTVSTHDSKSNPCHSSPQDISCSNYSLRRTVVIDSDGEREVEEAVSESSLLTPMKARVSSEEPQSDIHDVRVKSGLVEPGSSMSGDKFVYSRTSRLWKDKLEDLETQYKSRKRKSLRSDYQVACTTCGVMLKANLVLRHPKLEVPLCKQCKNHYLRSPFGKDEDGSDCECSWCGEGGEVVCCSRCDKVFCQGCITRNFGSSETFRIVTDDDWLCYFCNPTPLSILTQKLVAAELQVEEMEEGSEEGVACPEEAVKHPQDASTRHPKKGRHRKNIRKVLDDDELEEKQKELLALEKERQERLEKWKAVSNNKSIFRSPAQKKMTSREPPQAESEDISGGLPINNLREPDEEAINIAPGLARTLKPHQILGVRFMWENCVESVKKVRSSKQGYGCILAHSMGLGKTLQVITFIHTVLNSDLPFRTALIVVPVNVLHNWKREFEIWQADVSKPVSVFMLEDSIRENTRRALLLSSWQSDGGVMLIGYSAFRNLSLGKHVRDKATRDALCESLQNPGPDLLVCDEAHTIKNGKADITQVLKQVKTGRRIALTGSPLQNNLMEYYCMVDFVREGFLGTPQTFKNRFQNPIENGQHLDSTKHDVRLMKQRAHVLHKTLKGFVQRMDTSVLKDELPPKCVYVIAVRLSSIQRRLYEHYLQVHGLLQDEDEASENKSHRRYLFNAYHALAKIWNHPDLLLAQEDKVRRQEDSLEDFTVESEEEKLSDIDTGGKLRVNSYRQLKKRGSDDLDELEKPLWWKDIMENRPREDENLSGKMVLLLQVLAMSASRGDKTLVFSQSLGTLDLIERFLEKKVLVQREGSHWEQDRHWYRLDGSTPAAARLNMCERFNDPSNTIVKCVLISTRAGSLGINLPAANRVVIVDGSWNPTHDLQAIFRAWRLGQKKPVYAYRLLACGTMEEKIYNRQVAKEGVAARVLDTNYPERIFTGDDLDLLFRLEADGDEFVSVESESSQYVGVKTGLEDGNSGRASPSAGASSLASASKSKFSAFNVPDDAPPRDDLMGKLLLDHRPRWVVRYHEHEPLLEHREEETLSTEEQSAAWEAFRVVEGSQAAPLQNMTTFFVQDVGFGSYNGTAGSIRPLCSNKDHAAVLHEQRVLVNEYIICATCMQNISWNSINTAPKQPPKGKAIRE